MTRVKVGQGQGGRKNQPRAQRLTAIMIVLVLQAKFDPYNYLSADQIALRCGMANSPHFRGLLDQLIVSGLIKNRLMKRAGRWPGYEYSIVDNESYAPKKKQREIMVNGQLTLWG